MMVFDNLLMGFGHALTPEILLYTGLGTILGTAIGVLPGLGPSATIGLLLPITFGMNPLAAMAMLCGIYYGAQYGGSTTSILLNMPGESASVVTCLDGHQMAKKGRGGQALGIAAIGSFAAGIVGTFLLLMLGEPLSRAAMAFGPAEYTILMALGLCMATSFGGHQVKAVIMCILGLLIGTIGTDSFSGVNRFTFDTSYLQMGLDLVPVLMGLFAMSEIVSEIEQGIMTNPEMLAVSTKLRNLLPNLDDLKQSFGPILRGSVGGFLIAVLPGIGATATSFMSYALERKVSKHPEKFGTGTIEGVAGPETANNAASIGAMVPLFTLGIPGTATAAILAGGMMMYGLIPGPLLFRDHPDFIYGLICTMFLGNVMLVLLNLPLISLWIKMLKIPLHFLYPVVIGIIIVGGYSVNFDPLDLVVIGVFGLFGYLADKSGFPTAPLILGFFLGPAVEANIRKALIVGRGDMMIFFQRPISLVLMTLIVLVLVGPTVVGYIRRKMFPSAAAVNLRDVER
ncbi:MAG TPA: tripartite tricarboxylate transporter permease [Selenomonadales bacterium]|nr:tripartite tricarboxylate transporter permease [Selenomonadales bacterium]